MSTNSTIKIKRKDGTETGIYCHWDGYVEGVGVTLQLAYNTAEKVEKLLALGDLSVLGYYTEPKGSEHNFENPEKNVCVAYCRDRGEEFSQTSGNNEEFIYTFDEAEAVWYVEEEQRVANTEAIKTLCMNCFYRRKQRLLLDAIFCCDFAGGWEDDEFTTADMIVENCTKKAVEARQAIIDEREKEYEANYRAFCD